MDDFQLAMQMQFAFDESEHKLISQNGSASKVSLVDHSWELFDPNPDARGLFLEFNDAYFWGKLAGVEVRWSPRMTTCAGICCYEGRAGLCSIRLSKPLLTLRPRKDLVETLLHEMIHAYLFVTENNKDHDGHGPEFHKHMHRINKEAGTNISVYHNFHDEVEHYKRHWWKCDGPCQKRPPYFGILKRASNRAPSANDFWWPQHQATCGGTYHKFKEPEGYGQKKAIKQEKLVKPNGCQDIRDIFGGVCRATGTNSKPMVSNLPSENTTKEKHIDSKFIPSLPLENSNGSGISYGSPTRQRSPGNQSSVKSFSGPGVTLSRPSSNMQRSPNQPIVRNLPGFGIISNERPIISGNAEHVTNCGTSDGEADNSDDDVILYSPLPNRVRSQTAPASPNASSGARPWLLTSLDRFRTGTNRERKSSAASSLYVDKADTINCDSFTTRDIKTNFQTETKAPINTKILSRHADESRFKEVLSDGELSKSTTNLELKGAKRITLPHMVDSDSETEFDTILSSIRKTRKIAKKMKKSASLSSLRDLNKSPAGSCKKITAFMSVCNPQSPGVMGMKNKQLEYMGESPELAYKRGTKVQDFALHRDKRAHDLISSDSEEEGPFISNAMKKKKQKNEDWFSARTSKNTSSSDLTHNGQSSVTHQISNTHTAFVIDSDSNDEERLQDVAVVSCPVCLVHIPAMSVNEHLDRCLGMA